MGLGLEGKILKGNSYLMAPNCPDENQTDSNAMPDKFV
jgi:hypothetical protein